MLGKRELYLSGVLYDFLLLFDSSMNVVGVHVGLNL